LSRGAGGFRHRFLRALKLLQLADQGCRRFRRPGLRCPIAQGFFSRQGLELGSLAQGGDFRLQAVRE
jgi:hypothetical protein